MDQHKHIQMFFFFGLLVGSLVLAFFIFRPFFYALIFAGALAVVFEPLERKISSFTGNKRVLSSLLTTLIAFFIILVPLGFFGARVFYEGQDLYTLFAQGGTSQALSFVEKFIQETFPSASFNLAEYAEQFSVWIVKNIGPIFSGVTQVIAGALISFLSLFFFLKDGSKLKEALFAYSPLEDRYDKEIVRTLVETSKSVLKGTLVVAICQGIVAGIGFWIFGLPSPALWGFVTILTALIPAVGTMIVVLPASLYLFFATSPLFGLGMFLWGALLVSTIDNVLRPILIEKAVKIHPFLIFLSVIGGIQFFGPIGFLLGPIVLSLLFALFNIYPRLFGKG